MLEYHTSKSVVTVQRAFRAKYAKDPPTDKTIHAWYKQFTETGCLCKQKSSGRPLTDRLLISGPNMAARGAVIRDSAISVREQMVVRRNGNDAVADDCLRVCTGRHNSYKT